MIFCFKSDILKYHLLLILHNFALFGLIYLCNTMVYIVLSYIYTLFYF